MHLSNTFLIVCAKQELDWVNRLGKTHGTLQAPPGVSVKLLPLKPSYYYRKPVSSSMKSEEDAQHREDMQRKKGKPRKHEAIPYDEDYSHRPKSAMTQLALYRIGQLEKSLKQEKAETRNICKQIEELNRSLR